MGKTIIAFFLFLFSYQLPGQELSADLFAYDQTKIETRFTELNKLENLIRSNPCLYDSLANSEYILYFSNINTLSNSYPEFNKTTSPGKIPSFWFTFTFSAIGTYFVYGAVAGPIATGIVYFSSDKDKTEVKKAIWGCITGTLVGAGIKYAVVHL